MMKTGLLSPTGGNMAELTNGFYKTEAQVFLNLCMQLNGTGTDAPIPDPPQGWTKIFDGHNKFSGDKEKNRTGEEQDGLGPFDNAWEFWHKQDSKQYAVIIRGTVNDIGSIVNDALATTLKSNGFLEVGPQNNRLPLCFAPVEDGAVHLGFSWGAAILTFHKQKGILRQLLQIEDNSEIYIVGHSQGAAIATLLHALFYHASQTDNTTVFDNRISSKNLSFKSYVFAQPKPGNWQFAQHFAQVAGNEGRAICINNSRDWVTQVPFSIGLIDDITANPIPVFLKQIKFIGKIAAKLVNGIGATLRWIRKIVGEFVNDNAKQARSYLFDNIDKNYLSEATGGISASASINYTQCGQLVSLRGIKDNKEKNDSFWQHHLIVYKQLIDTQLPNQLP